MASNILASHASFGQHTEVLVAGELDSASASQFESELQDLIDEGRIRLVVSFENVAIITSAGLRVLLVVAKHINQLGGAIAFYGCNLAVIEVFEMTGFNKILSICPSYEDAVAAVVADESLASAGAPS